MAADFPSEMGNYLSDAPKQTQTKKDGSRGEAPGIGVRNVVGLS